MLFYFFFRKMFLWHYIITIQSHFSYLTNQPEFTIFTIFVGILKEKSIIVANFNSLYGFGTKYRAFTIYAKMSQNGLQHLPLFWIVCISVPLFIWWHLVQRFPNSITISLFLCCLLLHNGINLLNNHTFLIPLSHLSRCANTLLPIIKTI